MAVSGLMVVVMRAPGRRTGKYQDCDVQAGYQLAESRELGYAQWVGPDGGGGGGGGRPVGFMGKMGGRALTAREISQARVYFSLPLLLLFRHAFVPSTVPLVLHNCLVSSNGKFLVAGGGTLQSMYDVSKGHSMDSSLWRTKAASCKF